MTNQFTSDDVKEENNFVNTVINWVLEYPGFFTPYKDIEDFFLTLASPIIAPVVLIYVAYTATLLALMLASLIIPVTIGAALLGAVFNQPEWQENVWNFMSSLIREVLKTSVIYTGLAILSIVGAPIGIVTRTIATLIDGIINFFTPDSDTQNTAMLQT